MGMWIEDPGEGERNAPITIIRATGQRPVRVAIRGEPKRVFVHFAAQRSWPCTRVHCALCRAGFPKRLYAFYPAYDQRLRPCILELTAQGESQLLHAMNPHTDSPRGVVQVSREGSKRNAPLLVEWEPPPEKHASLPDALSTEDLERALLRIWSLPARNGEASEVEYLQRLAETIALRTQTTYKGRKEPEQE